MFGPMGKSGSCLLPVFQLSTSGFTIPIFLMRCVSSWLSFPYLPTPFGGMGACAYRIIYQNLSRFTDSPVSRLWWGNQSGCPVGHVITHVTLTSRASSERFLFSYPALYAPALHSRPDLSRDLHVSSSVCVPLTALFFGLHSFLMQC